MIMENESYSNLNELREPGMSTDSTISSTDNPTTIPTTITYTYNPAPSYNPTIFTDVDFPSTSEVGQSTSTIREMSYEDIVNKRMDLIKEYSKVFSLKFNYRSKRGYDTLTKRLGERRMSILRQMKAILDEVYPDRFDFQFDLEARMSIERNIYGANSSKSFRVMKGVSIRCVNIVIWFPEISIKNKKDETTLIRDLYVKLPISISHPPYDTISLRAIEGTRTTLSMAEYESGYMHSHLPGISSCNNTCEYVGFCLGRSDLNMAIGYINTDLVGGRLNADMFRSLLFSIQAYLEWESMDTRPYIRMEEAIKRSYDYPDVTQEDCINIFNKIHDSIRRNYMNLDLDWSFIKGRYYIIDNDKLENLFSNMSGVSLLSLLSEPILLFKDSTGRYFVENKVVDPAILQDLWIPFQNEKKFFRIEGEIKRAIDRKRFIHPKIKEYVKSKLELYANYAKVREAGINKLNTHPNTR